MKALDPLLPGEVLVEDVAELLWRQVNPTWVSDAGVPTSQAFKPGTADEGKPSVARSSKQSAEEAHRWHTEVAKRPSAGTWAVAVGECTTADLRVVDDSAADGAPASRSPAHAYWDFRPLTKGELKKASAALLMAALRRGQVFRPSA